MSLQLERLHALREILTRDGVRSALRYLNGLTSHRFTALYRFDQETLKNLTFFDREDPEQATTPDIPVLASYCVFVRSSGKTFSVLDSRTDERVRDHPKRPVLLSYCGVPLRDVDGRMFGTICHFDFRVIGISDENVELLESVAPLLRKAVALHPGAC